MKNTIKMSLVAALAVAGLSQTASAASLEEAIKGVSISGKMEVEYDYTDSQTTGSATDNTTNGWDYDFDITAKVPVNDMVTAVAGFQADTTDTVGDSSTGSGDVNMPKIYFQYANGPVTAMVGKQSVGAPWFDDSRGNGVKVLYNAGPVTLAAAHFTGVTEVINNADVTAVAAIGAVGPVNASLWYAQINGITSTQDADSYTVNLNGTFDIVNVDLTHTATEYDNSGSANNDDDLTKVVVSANLGTITPYIGYGTTNDDAAGRGAGVDLDATNDASTNFGTVQLFIDDLNNADAWLIGATATVDAWKFDLSYVTGEYENSSNVTGLDIEETALDIEYKMSKNLTIDAYYSWAEQQTSTTSTTDTDEASIALEYKF